MARKSRWTQAVCGVVLGLVAGALLRGRAGGGKPACEARDPASGAGALQGGRGLVLVGVMTAARYLPTRARAVAHTWGRELSSAGSGSVLFFSAEGSRAPGLPLVALPGVDDSYPPQKKSFLMLVHMFEQYGERYEWFMRADDDVYVRGRELARLLRSVDSRRPRFLGQAGRGLAAERGSLALGGDNFCMGGPGVLLSRETLRRLAPHARHCLRRVRSTHEDVELGRCVARFAGVSCTWSYDMQTILHHNSSGDAAYTGRLKRREVHRAITLHPVKNHRHLYRLHSHFKNLRIQELRERGLELQRDLAAARAALSLRPQLAPPSPSLAVAALGTPVQLSRFPSSSLQDVVPFEFISRSLYSHTHTNPKRRIEQPMKEALDDVIREVMDMINAPSRQRGRVIDFTELLYGYVRLQPMRGFDLVLDLLLRYRRYRGRKLTAAVRRHAYLQQSFTGIEIRELPMGEPPPLEDPALVLKTQPTNDDANEYQEFEDSSQQLNSFIDFKKLNIPIKEVLETGLNKLQNLPKALLWSDADVKEYSVHDRTVTFLLPLAGRRETFARFMRTYDDVVLHGDEAARLVVVLYQDPDNPDDYKSTESLISYYKELYPHKDIEVEPAGAETFSRGAALTRGATRCQDHDLMFFVDVDIVFNLEAIRRIRINTIKDQQVYFPIVFSEYDPDVIHGDEFTVFRGETREAGRRAEMDDLGYFRQFGFGIASMYKSDLLLVGGFDLSIAGWGLEDVRLYEALVRSPRAVLRAPDAGLSHVHHAAACQTDQLDQPPEQRRMCRGSQAATLASDHHLRYFVLNHPEALWPRSPVVPSRTL